MLLLLLLLVVLGPGSGLGVLVSQHPRRVISRSGSSVEIQCSCVGLQVPTIFWYQQFPKQTIMAIATSNDGMNPTHEQGFSKDKFPIKRLNKTTATLMVTSVNHEDSGLYLCAASSGLGARVSQHPRRVISRSGSSVEIQCNVVGIQATRMVWYRQFLNQGLTMMAFSNLGSEPDYEEGFKKEKFSITHPNTSFSSLTVKSVNPEDSSFYLCAASDTELGRE
ncbi:T cell receptor beta variable 20-1, partial [Galemys pyrenaicus]